MVHVLFVCLGNICRSPAAEAVMNKLIKDNQLNSYILCDSAGTSGYHVGQKADKRMREVALKRGFEINSLSRQIDFQDLNRFDYIIAMDESNYYDINILDNNKLYKNKIFQLKDFCSDSSISGVPDPYYGGKNGFYHVLDILEDACQILLEKIKSEQSL